MPRTPGGSSKHDTKRQLRQDAIRPALQALYASRQDVTLEAVVQAAKNSSLTAPMVADILRSVVGPSLNGV